MSRTTVSLEPSEIIGGSLGVLKENALPLVGGIIVITVLGIILRATGAFFIGPLVLCGPLLLGMYKMVQAAVRGQTVEFGDVFHGFNKFLPAFLAHLMISVFSAIGTLLFVVPGILVFILYTPTYLFILDNNLDFWPAMEASRKMVMGNFGQWVVLSLVLFAINLAGLLACGIGLFVTVPLTFIAVTMAYERERRAICDAPTETAPRSAPQEPPVD